MKFVNTNILLLLFQFALGQSKVVEISRGHDSLPNSQNYKPEIFTSGFIDVINNGQVNASARLIRLFVGEPGKFSIPLSLYSGVSANNFQSSPNSSVRSNESLVTNFINPLSGMANISIENAIFFKRHPVKVTMIGVLYHAGLRILTGKRIGQITDPSAGKPINFLNSFGSLGLYFQTGAWERNNTKNIGVCWFAVRYIGCYTNPQQLKKMMAEISTNGLYYGYSLSWGVDINYLVNIKVLYYKYTKKPEIDYSLPIYQFSFNYVFKK